MYCGNCGKQIDDNSKFCPYCGDKNTIANSNVNRKFSDFPIKEYKIGNIYNIISMVLVVFLMFRFISAGISRYQANLDAFDWVGDSARTMGIVLHWGLVLMIIGSCAEYIYKFVTSKMNIDAVVCIRTGIGLFVDGMILGIGQIIFNDYDWENDMSIVYYRIFGAYRDLIGITIVFAIVIAVCGILKQKSK